MSLVQSQDCQVIHSLLRRIATPGKDRPELNQLLDFFTSYPLFCFTIASSLLSFIHCFNFIYFLFPSARAQVAYFLCPPLSLFSQIFVIPLVLFSSTVRLENVVTWGQFPLVLFSSTVRLENVVTLAQFPLCFVWQHCQIGECGDLGSISTLFCLVALLDWRMW